MNIKAIVGSVATAAVIVSCSPNEQSPGVEYMPDMYRSPAVEAYVDYENLEEQSVRKPVDGTIVNTGNSSTAWINFPYPYPNTPEGYESAGTSLKSPLKTTEATIAQGKEIYTKFCQHCHGEKGAGDGAVVTNGGYPQPPAYTGTLKGLAEGKMFHTITYGKGQMGSHASQLNKEERWLVIQYVKTLMYDGTNPDLTPKTEEVPAAEGLTAENI
ncbi:MAG: c-type cytochrome [Luteibaculum sp.]